MIAKISALRWGLSSAVLVNLPGLLQLSSSGCSGLCGSCGAGCAIAGLTAGGFLTLTRFYKSLRARVPIAGKPGAAAPPPSAISPRA
ncbi:hypothetical protein HSX37_04390|uniref:Uncharacterized protein n=1 Tax=Dendrosporobacter quercicolus TaxID=146817 RepID=A0A1G9NC12_9FIRM|nr:hypothetical protein [Dendrosporobacter quercicolus]NSL47289.1 hypothetical protein [Dendrosporobacter quercicolus DSM 1736]SDL83913.1 hypothetical protein SAMN04488502_101960 [Dendrosporobacter quercicolus]